MANARRPSLVSSSFLSVGLLFKCHMDHVPSCPVQSPMLELEEQATMQATNPPPEGTDSLMIESDRSSAEIKFKSASKTGYEIQRNQEAIAQSKLVSTIFAALVGDVSLICFRATLVNSRSTCHEAVCGRPWAQSCEQLRNRCLWLDQPLAFYKMSPEGSIYFSLHECTLLSQLWPTQEQKPSNRIKSSGMIGLERY
jgi:hypothetical protein